MRFTTYLNEKVENKSLNDNDTLLKKRKIEQLGLTYKGWDTYTNQKGQAFKWSKERKDFIVVQQKQNLNVKPNNQPNIPGAIDKSKPTGIQSSFKGQNQPINQVVQNNQPPETVEPTIPKKPFVNNKVELSNDELKYKAYSIGQNLEKDDYATLQAWSNHSKNINKDLRNGKQTDISKKLDILFKKSDKLDRDVEVTRYLKGDKWEHPEGTVFSDKGFTSVIANAEGNQNFLNKKDYGDNIVFKIKLKKGERIIPIADKLGNTKHHYEQELLLKRNSKFKVVKVVGNVVHLDKIK